ncbi:TlpA disulfide reductase family protein [Sphingobacterium siyangense]|uniref:TlpA family protein disulfide reductase n=1 Tax=Sphingobacterium siyangense TaxID=459529 RepID=UPI002FD9120D
MIKRSKSLTVLLDKVVNIPVIQITILVILFILVFQSYLTCFLKALKSIRAFIVLALMFHMFSLSAQTPRQDSGADGPTPLQIGDRIPEELWDSEFFFFNEQLNSTQKASLKEFKARPLVLDFWNTGCAPCLTGLAKLSDFSRGLDIGLVAVSEQTEKSILSFFKRNDLLKGTGLRSIIADSRLKSYFPHESIPHLVWINKEGVVVGLTGSKEITKDDLLNFATKGVLHAELKPELQPNFHRFIVDMELNRQVQSTHDSLLGYAIITNHIKDISPFEKSKVGPYEIISYRNRSILSLYRLAYADRYKFAANQIIWNVSDPERFEYYLSKGEGIAYWEKKNLICFESKSIGRINMADLLNSSLGLNVCVRDSLVECIVVKAGKGRTAIKPKSGSEFRSLKNLIKDLRLSRPNWQIIDSIKGEVRIPNYSVKDFETKDKLCNFFKENGLIAEKDKRIVNFLIIQR